MKIQSSAISMASQSTLFKSHTKDESLKTWVGNQRPNFQQNNNQQTGGLLLKLDILDLSKEGMAMQNSAGTAKTRNTDGSISFELSDADRLKIDMLQKMIEALTGKKINFILPEKIKIDSSDWNYPKPTAGPTLQNAQPIQQRAGWGLEYEYHEAQFEMQKMSFSANGIVKTADGREIDFSMQLTMSRSFYSSTDISIRAGDAVMKDPLVINFDGNAASLTSRKYAFDLDNDGMEDQISFVGPGSGFLALDSNNDGIINNGSELFGPQSGNGFGELAKYDGDGNGWIDENDEIFNKLRIWTKDENGNDRLLALGQKGIGAIYLGNVSTAFDMKDNRNEPQGAVRNTGVFLRENGTAGTVQHIDLAV